MPIRSEHLPPSEHLPAQPVSLDPTPPHLPQTADRALQLLLSFDRHHPERGVSELAAEFGLSTTVTQRLLAVLAHRGFLTRVTATRRYRLGPAALHLGRQWDHSGSLALLIGPILSELSELTGLGAYLSLPDGAHTRCVLLSEAADGRIRNYSLVGELYPAHAGATSKAYFAFLPPAERSRLLRGRPMARFTPDTVTDLEVLEHEYAEIRRQRWAFTVGEFDAGVASLAVPVFLRGEPYGSLSLGWLDPRSGQEPPSGQDELVSALTDRAQLIELRLSIPTRKPPAGNAA